MKKMLSIIFLLITITINTQEVSILREKKLEENLKKQILELKKQNQETLKELLFLKKNFLFLNNWQITMAMELDISIREIESISIKHNGKNYLDMTKEKWKNMTVYNQQIYANAYQKAYAKYIGKNIEQKEYKNGVFFKFMLIPPGKFLMGSPLEEKDRLADREKQHSVLVTNAFYIGKNEVTQAQWRAVAGNNPSHFKGDKLPVEKVSWNDIKEKFLPNMGSNFRLPTDAEWELACRAGVTAAFNLGEDITIKQVNYNGNNPYEGNKGVNIGKTGEVGSLPNGNAYGLYDMHGNVWEWCKDYYRSDYENLPEIDPTYEEVVSFRVIRGGSWRYYIQSCRSAYRNYGRPSGRGVSLGFRLLFRLNEN